MIISEKNKKNMSKTQDYTITRQFDIVDKRYLEWLHDFNLFTRFSIIQRFLKSNWYIKFFHGCIEEMKTFCEGVEIKQIKFEVYKYRNESQIIKTYYYRRFNEVEIVKMAYDIADEHLGYSNLADEQNYISLKIKACT